eukprot:TRINITY_DN535_c0_g1_i1.p2 TRINITY_DN535_c0_g1~~TRINITY_DN535_c0_g1_i1.p2  ORF type:complete len:109 (+),score=48.88 TRINITY_DN535_c0_g1_i1:541-867(+)
MIRMYDNESTAIVWELISSDPDVEYIGARYSVELEAISEKETQVTFLTIYTKEEHIAADILQDVADCMKAVVTKFGSATPKETDVGANKKKKYRLRGRSSETAKAHRG